MSYSSNSPTSDRSPSANPPLSSPGKVFHYDYMHVISRGYRSLSMQTLTLMTNDEASDLGAVRGDRNPPIRSRTVTQANATRIKTEPQNIRVDTSDFRREDSPTAGLRPPPSPHSLQTHSSICKSIHIKWGFCNGKLTAFLS